MRRSEKKQLMKAIYEDNLVVTGRREAQHQPRFVRPDSGKRIVHSRRHPSLVVLSVVLGIALAYSAVSISWDGATGGQSGQNVTLALADDRLTAETETGMAQAGANASTAPADHQAPAMSQTGAMPASTAATDSAPVSSVRQDDVASLTSLDSAHGKVAIEDSLDHFFYDLEPVPDSPEPPAGSDINAYKVFTSAKNSLAKLFGLGVRTIVIDPGHGGKDPGAVGHEGSYEKHIALEIARALRDRLQRQDDFKVLMTREEDVHVPLSQRVAFANDNNADLFISIHINSFHSENVNFIETYYFGPNNDTKVMNLAEKENSDSDYVYAEFKDMIQKIGDTMKFQESKKLAGAVQDTLYTNMRKINSKASNHGIKPGPFVVLLGLDAPSILTEVASLTNKLEEQRLNKPEYRDKIAEFLEKGIVSYLNKGASGQDPQLKTAQTTSEVLGSVGDIPKQPLPESTQDTSQHSSQN